MRYRFVFALALSGCATSASFEPSDPIDDADAAIGVLQRDGGGVDGSPKASGATYADASPSESATLGGGKQSGVDLAKDASSAAASMADASPQSGTSADASRADAARPATIPDASGASSVGSDRVTLPPQDGQLDYQLGLAYPPPRGVRIVTRDRTAAVAPDAYNICYVNGFQAQEADERFWLSEHPDLLLRDGSGQLIVDDSWNEPLLDVSSVDKREQLAAIVGGWIADCARSGYDAVEVDNLDSYTRSGGRIAADDAVAFLGALAQIAHAHSLAIAQKNASELVARRRELATDFALAEECNQHDECDAYVQGYGERVLMIEYQRSAFDEACELYPEHSVTLRDLDLVGPNSADYVYDAC